jgi:hypothetical protein
MAETTLLLTAYQYNLETLTGIAGRVRTASQD